jgi:diaminohydroxyphosphoribosylaminopyrimidine deaminase/5-amino-6-(5-phosphoribosylamino)uracil reductase
VLGGRRRGWQDDPVTTRRQVSGDELAAMARAVELAALGAGTALPNPVVGCVLIDRSGGVLGEGFHQHPGGPHAEVAALAAAGERAAGSTAVVTLEPCNHTGRTGPCSEALIAAGVTRVVLAVRDPWPPAAGGADRLRAAGVQVVELPAVTGSAAAEPSAGAPDGPAVTGSEGDADPVAAAVDAAEDVNRVWLGAMRNRRPFVTVKAGMTIDGRVAAADGSTRWITSPQSRRDVHELRRRVDTIMVGIGTVLADDPQLTARDDAGALAGRQPLRVVVDSHGRTPGTARVLDASAETLVATTERFGSTRDGRVDLGALLDGLFRGGRRHVLLEGGPRLAAAFLDAGLVDEVLVYVAPLLLGAGRIVLEDGAVTSLADAHRAELREIRRFGPDVALRYRMLR